MPRLIYPLLGLLLIVANAFASDDSPRILCYGDSITYMGTWLSTVEKTIDVKMINAGRSGRKAAQAKTELSPYLKKYADLDQIILFLGVNDLPARDKRPGEEKVAGCVVDMNEAIDLALTRFEPNNIILAAPCTVNPDTMSAVNLEKGYQITPPLLEQLEIQYKALARQRKISFMSLLHVVSKENYLDGLHPNRAGNDEIAAAVCTYLEKNVLHSPPDASRRP